jgi:hypothetical protein
MMVEVTHRDGGIFPFSGGRIHLDAFPVQMAPRKVRNLGVVRG